MNRSPDFLKTSPRISLLVFSVLLYACGLDCGNDVTSQSSKLVSSEALVTSSFSGSVGDGPVVAATLSIYDRDGNLVSTVTSDNRARYSAKVKAKGKAYLLTIEVDAVTDLVTGLAPDFRMTSVISQPSRKNININPFTTMIVAPALADDIADGKLDGRGGSFGKHGSFTVHGSPTAGLWWWR